MAAGGDVRCKDSCGEEPLHWAAQASNAAAMKAVVQALVAACADMAFWAPSLASLRTCAVHWAATNSCAEQRTVAVQALVAAGADAPLATLVQGRCTGHAHMDLPTAQLPVRI